MQSPEHEYDSQIAHTIWELERSVKRGRVSDATRRVLVEAHAQQLQMIEDRAGVAPDDRSFLLLQTHIAPGVLILPAEGSGCAAIRSVGRYLHRAGFSVLGSSLAYRQLSRPGYSPQYWQTCLDECEQRYDMLKHYASRIAILSVGLGTTLALHVVTTRNVSAAVALFPTLHADLMLRDRLKLALRRFRMFRKQPASWAIQRRVATEGARQLAGTLSIPLFVVAEESAATHEAARSARVAKRLLARRAEEVHEVPAVQASPEQLPDAVLEEVVRFLRRR